MESVERKKTETIKIQARSEAAKTLSHSSSLSPSFPFLVNSVFVRQKKMMQRSLARNARVGVVVSGDAPSVRPVASSSAAGGRRGCCAVAAKKAHANDAPSPSRIFKQLAHSSSSLRRKAPSLIVSRAEGSSSGGADGDEDEKVRRLG